jgi:hypothetical protein
MIEQRGNEIRICPVEVRDEVGGKYLLHGEDFGLPVWVPRSAVLDIREKDAGSAVYFTADFALSRGWLPEERIIRRKGTKS